MATIPSAVFRQILALLFVSLWSLSAVAQPAANPSDAVEGLRRANELMGAASWFFTGQASAKAYPDAPASKGRVPATPSDYAENYRNMREATALFLHFVSADAVANTLTIAQQSFERLKLPKPRTLEQAIEECIRRQNLDLSDIVSRSMGSSFYEAWQQQAANAKHGEIVDNPKLYGAVNAPANGLDLLRNLKWVLDHDAVLRADFFTSANMKRFFGTAAPVKREFDRLEARWQLGPPQREGAALPPTPMANCTYFIGRAQSADGNATGGRISIDCNYPNPAYPTFDQVRQVFGDKWQTGYSVFGPPLHGAQLPNPTAPHGNETMVYTFSAGRDVSGRPLQRRLVVEFDAGAFFKRLWLSEEPPS